MEMTVSGRKRVDGTNARREKIYIPRIRNSHTQAKGSSCGILRNGGKATKLPIRNLPKKSCQQKRLLFRHSLLKESRRRSVTAQIPARHLLWSIVIGCVLRESSFHVVEALISSKARRALDVGHRLAWRLVHKPFAAHSIASGV
jgi:hypothetical protein